MNILQRAVEIVCKGVTNGGVITGELFIVGATDRRDFSLEMVGAGLATVDQRKIDYGEASKTLVEAQKRATENKVGIWSLQQEKKEVRFIPKCNLFVARMISLFTIILW